MTASRSRSLWTASLLFTLAFVALGFLVSHSPEGRIDAAVGRLGGHGSLTAWMLTISGFFPTQAVLAALIIAFALYKRSSISVTVAALAALLAAQIFVVPAKVAFHRVRPIHWFVRHEYTLSYPSGHAATAVAFLGMLIFFLRGSVLSKTVKNIGTALLAAWILGISASRVALGAHYLTDVVGGWLLGVACLCATLAVYTRFTGATARVAIAKADQMPANHS
ncbi:MAG: phosphatase PAP2 family protein [Candidatus Eremiobacteraeota bacterium]|nr:phosphatase PAP2 family protein [Candidatus Eremiobacteraeota bacterium]MBC5826605.1 phosphatase PAP2 family protein [Candidatus Eremiobacteraeota bacterium]